MMIDTANAQFLAISMLRRFEELRLAPYFCAAGKLTVGYGHVILAHEQHLRAGVTEDMAEYLLLRDTAWAIYEARRVGRVLSDGRAAALASLIFNIGLSAWVSSTIRAKIVAGDFESAANEFGRWVKVRGVVNAGLQRRRALERDIFAGGLWAG